MISCMITCFKSCSSKDCGSPNFDNHKSTKDNYVEIHHAGMPPAEHQFFGLYRDIRYGLDHSHHGVYSLERQLWQDAAIRPMLEIVPPFRETPWLIYTAGGMGVGKGRSLERLAEEKLVAWENMVYVNADKFKCLMPEYRLYPLRGVIEPMNFTGRGGMTQQESAYIQEVATEAALKRGSDILIDSSFKDSVWYCGRGSRTSSDPNSENWKGDILRIKEKYPAYRIAVFHILMDFADDDGNRSKFKSTLATRLEGRARKTGRAVPLELALASVDGAARSVSIAMEQGLVDLYAEFDNTEKLKLVKFVDESRNESRDTNGLDWDILHKKFPRTRADVPRMPLEEGTESSTASFESKATELTQELEDSFGEMLKAYPAKRDQLTASHAPISTLSRAASGAVRSWLPKVSDHS